MGDYGYGKPSYPAGASLDCLFQPHVAGDEMQQTEVSVITADLFYAPAQTLLDGDRVTITHLHGEAVAAPQTFAIVGGPVREHTMMHAKLELVTES
jgi:hypothetical protein